MRTYICRGLVGMILEAFGFLNLFGNFLPVSDHLQIYPHYLILIALTLYLPPLRWCSRSRDRCPC